MDTGTGTGTDTDTDTGTAASGRVAASPDHVIVLPST